MHFSRLFLDGVYSTLKFLIPVNAESIAQCIRRGERERE